MWHVLTPDSGVEVHLELDDSFEPVRVGRDSGIEFVEVAVDKSMVAAGWAEVAASCFLALTERKEADCCCCGCDEDA